MLREQMILETRKGKQEVSKRRKSGSGEKARTEASTLGTRCKLLYEYHRPGSSLGHHHLATRSP
ncbi:hypothetical protein E2C01_043002 [Portunus trituberculatus]|uniref:Uncharacterized protein n=1 Tax=Portunus trituberculatus TaxID=210409 RepID=A0A5B7FUI2_PORTR|nr:hypothetical protein [Portunus trituberculatus]